MGERGGLRRVVLCVVTRLRADDARDESRDAPTSPGARINDAHGQ